MKHSAPVVTLEDLGRLHDSRANSIRPVLLREGCDRDDFDDVRQEAFLRAMRGLPYYRGDAGGLRSWLGTIIKRRYLNYARDKAAREKREAAAAEEWAHRLNVALRSSPEHHSLIPLVAEAMSGLGEADQRVMWLRYAEGIPSREIAKRSGLKIDTVRKRLSRAKSRLREIFTELSSSDTIA